ncbi:hypothetical protein GGR20_001787 [Devosia subaequoris]|uniref:(Na+)-NQR maturation NqrM n=1 Tax=Devosia subaequoris TaxID=395930 RepID=A0A7W6IM50_9HYPH|nr:(Na+)-NQR maturation NqrM [Devosia subaequoris]MBB4052144.1 hypothetical protein [Devosia subaequoris]MCP1209309.1 (Na+)-NQR maturation NqrM [Devosia subaequoris]
MSVFLASLVVFGLAVSAMALGVMAGRAPIKGSCGGLSCIAKLDCEACPHRNSGGDAQ